MTDKLIQMKDANGNNLYPCIDYNNASNRPSINGVSLIGNKTLEELGLLLAKGKKLLWENPNPGSSFNGQTISLLESADNFDFLLFVSSYQGINTIWHTDIIATSGNYSVISYKDSTTNTSTDTTMAWRNVAVNGTSVTINNAMYNSASGGGYNRSDLCIPTYIYGVSVTGAGCGGSGHPNKELLWTNTSPGSSFAAQTITLSKDSADYDAFIVETRYSTTTTTGINSNIVLNDGTMHSLSTYRDVSMGATYTITWRNITINGTSAVFTACNYQNTGGGGSDNSNTIPIKIYGIYFGSYTTNNYTYNLTGIGSELVDLIYPVGAIYASTSSASPGTLFGGTWTQLTNNNYNTKQWPTSTTTIASGGNNSTTLTITTNGGPVYLAFTGDANATTTGVWGKASIRRGSTILCQEQWAPNSANSANESFSVQCLDVVAAGTYTYTFYIQSGNGSFSLNEDGSHPCTCTAFEIGADPSVYKWRRTA